MAKELTYKDPETKGTRKCKKIAKAKNKEGENVIHIIKDKKILVYNYEEFAQANPGFKEKLSY